MTDKISSSATPIDIIKAINEIDKAIPNVGNGTVTFTQDDEPLGSITMNQSGNTTIEIAGASGIVDQEFDPTSIKPQSGVAIAGEGYLKEHQDISHLQLKSNLTTELTGNSTNIQYPGAKTVYDAIHAINTEAHGDWICSDVLISTSGTGTYDLTEYLPEDADTYWYEILFYFRGYEEDPTGTSNTCYVRTVFYFNPTFNDIPVGKVSTNSKHFTNVFSLAFPPGSRTKIVGPYHGGEKEKSSEYYYLHLMRLLRTESWKSFEAGACAYRRLGTTPYNPIIYPSSNALYSWMFEY